jgi:two-component system invasion response regulator UvrY
MSNVLLIDDHWAIREGVERALAREPDLQLIATAPTLTAGFDRLRNHPSPIDVVILDAMLGNESGIEAIPQIKALRPKLRVLVLSMLDENPHAVRVIEQGADGFVSKGGAPSELVTALRTVLSGKRYVSPLVGHLLAERLNRNNDLTPRESEVVRYYAAGRRCGEIAHAMSLSPKTVSAHKANAMRKLNISSNADLIRWAMSNGMT